MLKRKEADFDRASLLCDVSVVSQAFGYRNISPAVLEKDILSVQALNALGLRLLNDEYQPVFCGSASLSKTDVPLNRISENIEFELVRFPCLPASSPERTWKDLVEMMVTAVTALEGLGYAADDLDVQPNNDRTKVTISAYYRSQFDPDPALIERIDFRFDASAKISQNNYANKQTVFFADAWLPDTLKADFQPIFCSTPLQTISEKIIAFPKGYAKQLRGRSRVSESDFSLVKHLYDVSLLNTSFQMSSNTYVMEMLRAMTQSTIANELRRSPERHPEFVTNAVEELLWAMTHTDAPDLMQKYERFVNQVVCTPGSPTYQEALTSFYGLLNECLNRSGQIANGSPHYTLS